MDFKCTKKCLKIHSNSTSYDFLKKFSAVSDSMLHNYIIETKCTMSFFEIHEFSLKEKEIATNVMNPIVHVK